MKILRIITRLNMGGPAIHVLILTENVEETLLCYGGLTKGEAHVSLLPGIDRKFSDWLKFREVPSLQRGVDLVKDWRAFWAIRRIIKQFKPDIIHTHTAKAGFLGRLAGLSFGRRIKLVHTFHGHIFHDYFGRWRTRVFLLLERFLGKRTDMIICLNAPQRWDLVHRYKVANWSNVRIIPLGLELERFRGLDPPKQSSVFNVAIVGRLTPIKNHRMFLNAVKRIKDREDILRYWFYVVGGGELEDELHQYARMLGVEDNVVWWGWEKDLAEFYWGRNIHLVVNTSLNEGTPVSLIEAIVAGREVICANFDGAYEFVSHAGWNVEVNDEEGLAKKIQEIRMYWPKGNLSCTGSRDDFYRRYSSDRLIYKIKDLYESLCKEVDK